MEWVKSMVKNEVATLGEAKSEMESIACMVVTFLFPDSSTKNYWARSSQAYF